MAFLFGRVGPRAHQFSGLAISRDVQPSKAQGYAHLVAAGFWGFPLPGDLMISSFSDFVGEPLPFLISIVIAMAILAIIKGVYNLASSYFARRRYRRMYGKTYSESWRVATKRRRR